MDKKVKFALLATAFASLMSCGGGENGANASLEGAENYVADVADGDVFISGVVSDATAQPLSGVLVSSGKDTTITDKNGFYQFTHGSISNGRCVVKFDKKGYFSVVRTGQIDDDNESKLDAIMQPTEKVNGVSNVFVFDADSAVSLKIGETTVRIPAKSLVYESTEAEYTGEVVANMYYLDPNSKDFTNAMPGGDMSAVTEDGKSVILLSYGMVEVTLLDTLGKKLQLKKGAESNMSFPSPKGFSEKQLHNSIPLWYFDEVQGVWVEEGVAEKNGNIYSGNVKHFSWHNLDYPNIRASICGKVTNSDGDPLPNIKVTVSQTYAFTDDNGYYCVYVPKETPVFVTVCPEDYAGYTNPPIYEVEGLAAKSVFTQNVILPAFPCVKGKVYRKGYKANDCPLYGVKVSASPRSHGFTNVKGEYSIYIKDDEPVTVSVKPEDYCGYKSKEYKFNDHSEIDKNERYNFELPEKRKAWGRVRFTDGSTYPDPIKVTVKINGQDMDPVTTTWYSCYCFDYLEESKDITVRVKSEDFFNCEGKEYQCEIYGKLINVPTIILATGQRIYGRIVNSCGPSTAKVSLYVGKKRKERHTLDQETSNLGDFSIYVPLTDVEKKKDLRINCFGTQVNIPIKNKGNGEDINIGNIDICGDGQLDSNCVYVNLDKKIVKFYLDNDIMEKVSFDGIKGIAYRTNSYQKWYKSDEYKGKLIIKNDVKEYYTGGCSATTHLSIVTPEQKVYENKIWSSSGKDFSSYFGERVYNISTNLMDIDGNDIYVYGTIAFKPILGEKYMDERLRQYEFVYGKSETDSFKKYLFSQTETKKIEDYLKKELKMSEKETIRDDQGDFATIFVGENDLAIIKRKKTGKSEVTMIHKEGIGNEKLYNCWKVSFVGSTMKSPTQYMWKSDIEIINMKMFGAAMGIKFEKTNIPEEKCGCSNGEAPMAN